MADRTSVKTQRVELGVYRTLDGKFEVARQEDSKWTLFDLRDGRKALQEGVKTSDAALDRIAVHVPDYQAPTERPKPQKPAPAKVDPAKVEQKKTTARPRVQRGAKKVA
jgi:hypothetical protein